jgi:LuxR family transcriptional regulator, maltose regulon positive regulatory protein
MTHSGTLPRDKRAGLPFPRLVGPLAGCDPPVADPAGVAMSGPDVLLATKLHVPRPQPGFVARPRLVQALGEGLAWGRVLVCAPAGSGKTALLADWARGGRRQVAWLSLDADDNDPARFWRYAVAALDRARPGLAGRVGPQPPGSSQGLVTALINELGADPGGDGLVLVLDDYHLVDSGPVHESVAYLLANLPPGLQVVVSGRADPPLPLARLRARGQLAELRAADLRFTGQEATALLGETAGPGLPEAAVAALVDRTEGWAAGLQLAGLSLRGQPDAAGFVAAFTGSHRFVLDYLTDEVLERQGEQVREFLLETSVLDRLSGELCDAVTGRTGSQAMLQQVERAGLFLVPLDEVRRWWRYHHLFADLLRTRLQRDQPGRVRELHHNAAAWSDEHGLADDAVRHALAAGDAAWAARLIERHVDAMLDLTEQATLQRRLETLPAELVRSRPRLLLVQTWIAHWAGQVESAGLLLDAAEHAFANATDEAFEPSVGRAASLLANVPAAIALARAYLAHLRGDADGTAAFASRALAEIGEGEWMLDSRIRWHMAVAEWLRGSLAEAEHAFTSVIARWRAAGDPGLAAPSCHLLGQVQRAQGRLDAAIGTYRQALEIATLPGRPVLPVAGIGYVGLAEVAYQRNELDAALSQVTEGIAGCRQIFYTPPLVTGLAALAWIRQAQGDAGGALEAMAEAERAAPGPAVTGLLNPVPAQRARLLLAQGKVAAAARWAEEHGLGADDELDYPREREYLVLARVLLAQGRPGLALALLERMHAAAAQGRAGSIIEISALRALALAANGEETAAVDALAEALTLGCPQGYVRVFADEGAPMRALLARLSAARQDQRAPARGIHAGYLAAVLRACGQADAVPPPRRSVAAPPGLAEPLTGRELEVLRMLAVGKSNQRIAHDLVVALDTVKKHVTHVLGKLGAANRTEAAAQARQLGLIP